MGFYDFVNLYVQQHNVKYVLEGRFSIFDFIYLFLEKLK